MTDGPFKPQGDDPAYHAVEVQCDGCGLTTVQTVECDARARQPEVEKLVKALKSLIEINDFEIRNRVWQEQWKAERFTKAREALRTVKGDK